MDQYDGLQSWITSYATAPLNFLPSWDTVSSWASDDTQVALATAGTSADTSVYDDLDKRLLTPPRDAVTAYEQAAYFLAIGARRADYEGNKAAQTKLYEAMKASTYERAADIGWICSTTGYGCKGSGRVAILQNAIDQIKTSGLNQDDQVRLTTYLGALKRGAMIRSAILPLLLVGGGMGIGYWWMKRRKKG